MVCATACQPGVPRERLAADVSEYLRTVQAWAPVEVEADQTITRILATQFVDDIAVLREIAESRPRIQRHLHAVMAYQPSTPDVAAVHRSYIEAWTTLLVAYDQIEQGIRTGDTATLSTGRRNLLQWRRTLRVVAADLRELAVHSGVRPEKTAGPVG